MLAYMYSDCLVCNCVQRLVVLHKAWIKTSKGDTSVGASSSSIAVMVLQDRWPQDHEVRDIVNGKNLDLYKNLRKAVTGGTITPNDGQITWVLSLLANMVTLHVTFGRPSLFQGLSVAHARQALQGHCAGVCASQDFKTADTYLIQCLYFCKGAQNLLRDWVEIWRPCWADKEKEGSEPSGEQPLFIGSTGAKITTWSSYLSKLWETTYKRKMNATVLRYWKATKVALNCKTVEEQKQITEADAYVHTHMCTCTHTHTHIHTHTHSHTHTHTHTHMYMTHRHSLPMAKKFYVKLFAIMDSQKVKRLSDKATGLKVSEQWNTVRNDTKESAENDSVDQNLLLEIPSAITPARRAHNAWCQADTDLLYRAWHKDEDAGNSTWGRYRRILAQIRPSLQNKDRTNTHLRDKWVNMEKARLRAEARQVKHQQLQESNVGGQTSNIGKRKRSRSDRNTELEAVKVLEVQPDDVRTKGKNSKKRQKKKEKEMKTSKAVRVLFDERYDPFLNSN
jgi:hypothetical protein